MFDDPSNHIKTELSKLQSGHVKLGHDYSFVRCPFHHERTPSLRVKHRQGDPKSGSWRCYGCSEYGRWNKLAEAMSLELFHGPDDQVNEDVPEFKSNVLDTYLLEDFGDGSATLKEESLDFYSLRDTEAIKSAGIKNNAWRGYDLEFLRKRIKAKLVSKTVYSHTNWYLYLPVLVGGEEVGYIKAQINKSADKSVPSYINASGTWSLTSGLFLFDQSIELMNALGVKTVVLVEGPRDALRLLKFGIPCMAILGTHSWSDKKSDKLEAAGVEGIISCFDGDDAGRIATKLIVDGKRENTEATVNFAPLSSIFDVRKIRLWKAHIPAGFKESKLDPGNMPERYLVKLRSLLA